MNLYLVQHALAKSKEEDPDRSLSELGLTEIDKVARYTSKNIAIKLTAIYHSGKTRAKQTANILKEHLRPDNDVKASDDLKPNDEPSIWADRMKQIDEDIMLVGHLPYLERLASFLVCGDESKKAVAFKNAGIVCLERNDSDGWSIDWIITPGIVK